mmetsp:Transcript_8876/g.10383  ORF Transcript_8876/g.10383 Transcript_8876/m.10383 type:complete len:128 (-) Transcript_8876:156-539(-)
MGKIPLTSSLHESIVHRKLGRYCNAKFFVDIVNRGVCPSARPQRQLPSPPSTVVVAVILALHTYCSCNAVNLVVMPKNLVVIASFTVSVHLQLYFALFLAIRETPTPTPFTSSYCGSSRNIGTVHIL